MSKNQLSKEEWALIKTWFNELINEPSEQLETLISVKTSDHRLQQALSGMLQVHHSSSDQTITPKQSPAASLINQFQMKSGDHFAKYQIIKTLGSGGMGEVYLAERNDQVTQKVALKILAKNCFDQQTQARFDTERRILASLEHPNIARLIDADTESGSPYYAMEFIDGVEVDKYCQANQLDLFSRLNLFLQICDAVSHAHKNLIVHRDLKPSNILVNDEGEVKLLDFGIAKPLKILPGTNEVYQTVVGSTALTPQYAAPEQVNGEAITVSCDIYVMGLLLYKLVTDQDAFDLADKTWGEIEMIINQDLPTLPSRQIKNNEFNLVSTWQKKVKGDVDAIISHALKKHPSERYETVRQFRDDIERFIRHEPIEIKRNQGWYRFKKQLRQNWFPVSAFTILFMVLLVASILIWQQSQEIATERDVALTEKQTAEEVTEFLVDTFKSADPTQTKGNELSAGEILDQAVLELNNQSLSQEIKNRLRIIIAEVYFNLGNLQDAQLLLDEVKNLSNQQLSNKLLFVQSDILLNERGDENASTVSEMMQSLIDQKIENNTDQINAYYRLARSYNALDKFHESKDLISKLISTSEEAFGASSLEHSKWLAKIANLNTFIEDADSVKELLLQAANIQEELLGSNHLILGDTKKKIAELYAFTIYDSEQALKYGLEAYEIYLSVYGEAFPHRVSLENTIASGYAGINDFQNAANHYEIGIDMEKKHFGNNQKKLAILGYNLANVYLYNLKDHKRAIERYEEVLPIIEESHGRDSQRFKFMGLNYARALTIDKQFESAKKILDETHEFYTVEKKNSYGEKGYTIGRTKSYMGFWHMQQNQWCESKKWLTESLFHLEVAGLENDQYKDAVANLSHVDEMIGSSECSSSDQS